jgi:hypothetical protein
MELLAMPAPSDHRVSLAPEVERLRIVSVRQAAELKGVSLDTFKRHYAHLIRKLSPRRNGVRLGDVLGDDAA